MKTTQFQIDTPEFNANPFPTLATMREAGPVVHMDFPRLGEAFVATTYESVQKVLRDQDSFVMDPRAIRAVGATQSPVNAGYK